MFITIYNRLKEMQNRDAFHNDTVVGEESTAILGGEDKKGLGEICKELKLPSNISTTLLIDGRLEGSVCIHHKLTIIIFFAISSSSLLMRPCSPSSSPSSMRL